MLYIVSKMKPYIALMRLHKPIGIFLLLWPTLWALWLASQGKPHAWVLIVFILGVVIMRSAGCVINDFADRYFDGYVARTRHRPLATGTVSVRQAMILFILLMTSAFLLVLLFNPLTMLLAVIGAVLAVFYPWMKRFTHLPQLGLGLAFSWGVPMAFAAETGTVSLAAWLLFLTAALWPVIYDTMYAMTDRTDDLKIGLKSTAILFGEQDKLIIGLLQILFLCCLLALGFLFKLRLIYDVALIIVAGFFIYQQYLIKSRRPDLYFEAFLNNHWVGLIIFLGIAASSLS